MKYLSFLFILALSLFAGFGCGSDDNNDPYEGIPTGEIVELDLRDAALSGSGSSGGRFAVGQKWWKHQNGQFRYNGTCSEETKDISLSDIYYGFYSSNQFFIKEGLNGDPELGGSWQWEDTNTKEALLINYSDLRGLELKLRALNNDKLVYLSEVAVGECTTLIWEELGEPQTE
ncbi:MAG: hypothetical protein ABJF04_07645 [Reichenbachiella sp.]|uniref:hypothetical protein n=1 Tax=Reichenbachiella sp. TaxID=2184521 RepID=UPI0032642B16